jgi:hypothetical protein
MMTGQCLCGVLRGVAGLPVGVVPAAVRAALTPALRAPLPGYPPTEASRRDMTTATAAAAASNASRTSHTSARLVRRVQLRRPVFPR